MNVVKWMIVCSTALLVGWMGSPAEAGILSSALTDNTVNTLIDNSYGVLVNSAGVAQSEGTPPVVGDVIDGYFQITGVTPKVPGLANGGLYGVFAAYISGENGTGGYTLTGVPTGSANAALAPYSLAGLLSNISAPAAATAALQSSNSIFAFVESGTIGTLSPGVFTATNLLSASTPGSITANSGSTSVFTTANGFSVDLVGGIAPSSTDFFNAQAVSTSFLETGAFSAFYNAVSGPLLPVTATLPNTYSGQLIINPSGLVTPSTYSGWDYQDFDNYQLDPTPEPSALAAILAMSSTFALSFLRRKRK